MPTRQTYLARLIHWAVVRPISQASSVRFAQHTRAPPYFEALASAPDVLNPSQNCPLECPDDHENLLPVPSQIIQRTRDLSAHRTRQFGINLRRPLIRLAQQFLHGLDVHPVQQQVGSEGMAQHMSRESQKPRRD